MRSLCLALALPHMVVAVVAASRWPAFAQPVETDPNRFHLMAYRCSTVLVVAAWAAIEIGLSLSRPKAAATLPQAAGAAAPESSGAVRLAWTPTLQPESCRPEYKKPASLPQRCGYKLGSVSLELSVVGDELSVNILV